MENKVKDTEIMVVESYGDNCLNDQINKNSSSTRRPKGEVYIYELEESGRKELVHKSNLVVYLGREMLAQRLVNVNNASVTPTKDEWVQWFGVGDGGVRPADPLDPVPPVIDDDYIYSPVMLTTTASATYADFNTAGDPTQAGGTYPSTGYYKKAFDEVVFEGDDLNESRFLVIKITTTIGVNDANGQQLSEAGLFAAEASPASYFSIFARVTYPTLIKTSERRLIFVWYLYV